ncbi:VOC family protein [Patescibacteria group bacterium]|nr:VOC family protein [Patescibacteria group bacterium]
MKFHHLAIKVFDFPGMLGFYQNLGFKLRKKFSKDEEQYAFLEGLGVRLELISGREEEEGSGFDHLSFQVKNLQAVYQEQKARGLIFLSEPQQGTCCKWFVFFIDPEENKLELYED